MNIMKNILKIIKNNLSIIGLFITLIGLFLSIVLPFIDSWIINIICLSGSIMMVLKNLWNIFYK
jgi:hypothetical protein